MCVYTSINAALCAVFILIFASESAYANSTVSNSPIIQAQSAKVVTLREASQRISAQSGIQFKFNDDVEQDLVAQPTAGGDWTKVINQLLAGYNYSVLQHPQQPKMVLISGRNGSKSFDFPNTQATVVNRNEITVQLPMLDLLNMQAGSEMTLNLPIGEFVVTRQKGEMGFEDWVEWTGKVKGGRVTDEYFLNLVSTQGNLLGNVYTPAGYYSIDSSLGYVRLVEVDLAVAN